MPAAAGDAITPEMIRQFVGKSAPVIVEIGCNDGEHTELFLRLFASPTIYCFEPDPRPIARFRARLAGKPNVRLFEMAVSDREGQITFYQSEAAGGGGAGAPPAGSGDASGSIRRPKNHLTINPMVAFERQITVPTISLDRWCEQHRVQQIDFLWMDVQGAEIDVFRGGRSALSRTRFIYTEYSELELYEGQLPLADLLRELPGFRLVQRFKYDVLLENNRFRGAMGPARA